MTELIVTQQGTLFKTKLMNYPYLLPECDKRGQIKGFSARARKRMFELFHRMNVRHFIFITLTYGQSFPDPAHSKRDLKVFIQRLKRFYPQVAGVWRIDLQQRGAPHFHFLLTNLPFLPKAKLVEMWEGVIAPKYRNQVGDTFTRIELVKSKRKAISYVSKYVGKKPARGAGRSGFNTLPYQTVCGKQWGIIGRKHLPFAKETIVFIEVDKATYKRFKNVFQWVSKIDKIAHFTVGFTLFTEHPETWLNLLMIFAYDSCA